MGNDTRFAITMTATLLMWSPSAWALANGNQTVTRSMVWFAGALALSYFGVTLINRLIVTYGTENAVREIQEAEARRATSDDADVSLDS